MNQDPRDFALQATVPTVMVPKFGTFQELVTPGHRLLVAEDGLWVEAKRPGIYSRQQIARQAKVAIPYGSVQAKVELQFGNLGKALIQFIEYAKQHLPNEVAMGMIWDDQTQTLEEVVLEPVKNGPAHITYVRPDLEPHQHLVVDFHSHGTLPAYFSATDNRDDRGDLKIAIVAGDLNADQPTVAARLCTMGHYLPLQISNSGIHVRDLHGEKHASAHFTG